MDKHTDRKTLGEAGPVCLYAQTVCTCVCIYAHVHAD